MARSCSYSPSGQPTSPNTQTQPDHISVQGGKHTSHCGTWGQYNRKLFPFLPKINAILNYALRADLSTLDFEQ